jgi:L-cysteine:1D-myo-inositol 2-amino-2-deoxy-alpha-D-glucopyranoside ligase
MVRLDGKKMSKSLGNLVFVSRLVAAGVDPMAIRLAIMSHRYRIDWDWTPAGLAAAQHRLAAWRAAVRRATAEPSSAAGDAGSAPSAESVLAQVRERLADDLDAPGALGVVDRWADAVSAAPELPAGSGPGALLVRDTVDALLGVAL